MARPASGQVVEKRTSRGVTFALRFRAYGRREYVTLGTAADGWTRERAEVELQNVLADVRRGIWRPPAPELHPADPPPEPTFHEFASEWYEAREGELRPKTRTDYRWALSGHLLPFFARHRLSEITVQEVDRYRQAKVREGVLSSMSINKTLVRLAQVLEVAVEYGLIPRNPATGKRRRLKAHAPERPWLDTAEHIAALLDAAAEVDAESPTRQRRAALATLMFAGLRIGELLALRWRDVDLAAGRLTIRQAKTTAGVRQVDLLPALRDELASYRLDATPRDSCSRPARAGARTRRTSASGCFGQRSSGRTCGWPNRRRRRCRSA